MASRPVAEVARRGDGFLLRGAREQDATHLRLAEAETADRTRRQPRATEVRRGKAGGHELLRAELGAAHEVVH